MKIGFIASALILIPCVTMAKLPNPGFYQTIDDGTHKPKSIVALYEYKDGDDVKLGGRIIALYDQDGNGKITETLSKPVRVATKVKGEPKMAGLDILWNMEWDADDSEYEDGKIMDPKKGSVYRSVIWQEKEEPTKLRVRGKIGPFGRTQTWNVMHVSDLPSDLQKLDTKNWKPVVME
ncbi:MAG: DUF2147 domain-containing protein [Alphaproteobacteria bacterium]|nr:DUF2147 domain-containing protein [Alphaproteobacteria bacterium]MBN2675519.1 DUF2147 domain-containing protein [Alphaproteobacteria bacterium]